eukprot:gb/GFBE01039730.1/.p1 GENE.gb/GFBE01039730.1/~~gb/GFBE01039730.1/.p1  ORF type:complete len:548 (+),score=139.27 gb/GFBE01039730.1/:1-1644(+)
MKTQAVVVRNTFLEVGDQKPLRERSESFRRQVSEPVKIFSSSAQDHGDQEDDSDEDFECAAASAAPPPVQSSGGLRADAPAFQAAAQPSMASAMAWQPAQPMMQHDGYAQQSMKQQKGQGKGKKQQDMQQARGAQDSRGQEQREAPRRLRDGQLSRLKDENITQMEPPWENVTTVMMRNLPNKYTQQMLLGELRDAGFNMQADFDFFYLPMDHSNCANLGYCFINFTKTCRANDFAAAFSGKRMRRFNSHKTAVIMPASIQGYEQNYTYYVSTRVAQAADPQYRPLFLRPLPALPAVDAQLAQQASGNGGKAQGKGGRERDQKGGKDSGKGSKGGGKTGRRGGRDWESEAGSGLGGDGSGGAEWNGKVDEDIAMQPQMSPQMPAAPLQQDYQVMCVACGTLCGSNYRFCSYCGTFLCDASGAGGAVMMATYFQPAEWGMMQEQAQMPMQSVQPVLSDQQQRSGSKSSKGAKSSKPSNKAMPQDAVQDTVAEELDILHGRMMLLAALKVAGSQQGGHCDTPMSSEDERPYGNDAAAHSQWGPASRLNS